ncbi:efflux transporter outer membrane subunit [Parvibaculum sp.]|uniref:efflux transporter outer membrane subunit n=1 Tax=Parvibaculum sp. TaxID=2024848 RepID=UPI00272FAD41|nr:efflux transporter outer membrane subunit [Parvibaculum sp.]MDP1627610.1 efflux transporter outer membrane subunit [Parvibaculum sp.]MDP2148789.1 efflux transporter outer membrane subunit [Parvibaculum sp.]MDP3328687.1 efflux transporter outer membrane subunit [Parvibaculum sp.]
MNKFLPLIVLSLPLLSACTLAPDYERPNAPLPARWPSGAAYSEVNISVKGDVDLAALGWRDFFLSDAMQKLIAQALENNRDLREAVLNVEEARALYRVQRADLLPGISGDGTMARERVPGDLSGTGQASTGTSYSVQANVAAYELDLFGRVRSLNEQALREYFSTDEARRAAQIALIAEVANAWLTLRADQRLLQLTEETLAAQERSYDLVKMTYERGMSSKLDLAQAQTAVETARVNRFAFIRQVAQDRNALTLLVGAPVDDATLDDAQDIDRFVADVPTGLPSDLLANRPDIRQAEHSLRGANANIGAARAAFFPRITLTAAGGTASSSLSGLFEPGSGAWSFMPQISIPIFEGGRNIANLEVAEVQKDINIARYEKSIQTAFREVVDALAGQGTYGGQLDAQRALVTATAESYALAERRYRSGIDSYLTLLDAQRSLYAAEQELIRTQLAQVSNTVTLYKVLGGGGFEQSAAENGGGER